MTLALRLAQQGKQVVLYEAANQLGGLASAWSLGDVVWDRHYHVTLLSDTALRSLLKELGLEHDMEWVQTKTGFYTDGRLYSMSNTLEFLKFPPLNIVDKLRLGATIFYASKIKNWKRLESITVEEWLRRLSGSRTFERIWLPLLRAKLGEQYKKASAAFIWAIIARMYAARRSGLKKEMFGYLPGGYARILERFGEVLHEQGIDIRLKHPVQEIRPCVGGGAVLHFQQGSEEKCDRVIVTAPAPIAAQLCLSLTSEERQRLRGIQYQGIICASLLLKRPLANYYVTNITDSWVPFTAIIEMSALVDRKHFGGAHLVYLPKYVEPEDPQFDEADDVIRERFVCALERMYPHFDRTDVLAFKISRIKYVLAISTLCYSDNLPPMATSVRGVHIVNSAHIAHGTLNVNETVQLAEKVSATLFR